MKVTYIAPSPKAGQTEHLQPHRAQAMIDAGFAVACPRAFRGTAKWLEEQKEIEEFRQADLPAARKEQFPSSPVWAVIRLDSGTIAVVRRLGTEKLIYGEVPVFRGAHRDVPDVSATEKQLLTALNAAGCPQGVVDKYLAAKKAPNKLVIERAAHEAAVEAQAAQQEREKSFKQY